MSARKPRPSVPEPILVLDLGTAALRVAVVVDGRPEVILFPTEGDRVPTVVGFDTSRIHSAQDRLVLGDAARRLVISEPRSQLTGALRLAGRRHELVPLDGDHWRAVPVVRGPGADVHACLAGENWPMPRLLGALIQSLVERLGRERGLSFERAIVSIAPGSDDARRRAVMHALRIAGFAQVELVHSTSAAALAWSTLERAGTSGLGIAGLEAALAGAGKLVALAAIDDEDSEDGESDEEDDENERDEAEGEAPEPNVELGAPDADGELAEPGDELEPEKPSEQLVLLLDLGAGSFDAALARFDGADIELLAAGSCFDLAGDEIDERIVEWLLGQFEDANEVDLSGDPTVRARMRDVAEKAKIALGDADRYEVRLPFLWADASGPKHLFVTLERERFERMIRDVVDAVAGLAGAVLDDAEQSADALDAVVMIGGCSRVPILQDRIERLLGRVPETELSVAALDDDFVVRGLALEAARRGRRRPLSGLADIAGRELWLRTSSGMTRVIERNGVRPVQRTIPLKLEGEGSDRSAEFELFEGNDDNRARALRGCVTGDAGTAKLRVSIDADGCIGAHVDAPGLTLVISQRVGLGVRALERLRREAGDRARAAAVQHRNEELRRRVWTLSRTLEAWLGEGQDAPAIDELLRTSLTQWRRDAEVALERGAEELLRAGWDAFASLRDALPAKLRAQIEEEAGEPEAVGEDEAAQLESLGEPSTDYDAHELVEPLDEVEEAEVEEAEVEEAEEAEEAEVEEAEEEEAEEEEAEEEEAEEEEAEEEEAEEEEAEVEGAEEEEAEVEGAEVEEAEVEEAEVEEAEDEEPEVVEAEPEAEAEEAEVEEPEPEVEEPEPEVAAAEPEVAAAEPEVAAAEPEVAAAEPEIDLAVEAIDTPDKADESESAAE